MRVLGGILRAIGIVWFIVGIAMFIITVAGGRFGPGLTNMALGALAFWGGTRIQKPEKAESGSPVAPIE